MSCEPYAGRWWSSCYISSALSAYKMLLCGILVAVPQLVVANDAETTFGIEKRVPWTTSRVTGSPDPPSPYRIERVFSQLSFTDPVTLTSVPNSKRLFVVELGGKIYSFPKAEDVAAAELAIDLAAACGSNRVYGLAFHPDFPRTPHCYICYTVGQDLDNGTRVSEFEVTSTAVPQIDAASERMLLTWRSGGHNGGCLKFGPDGYLYISTGDGGPAFPPDPLRAGQDVSNLLASILRIDVDHVDLGLAYAIPSGNPFVDLENARREVWAYGLRNPWRMSFDSDTGDLWVGDVGWELWEMVYRVQRGANYGWSLMEGPQPVHQERRRGPTPITPPTVQHSHIESRSITGGFVYRGKRLPGLVGKYVYGDYVTGKIWAVSIDGGEPVELVDTPLAIICFGVDHDQELYIVGYDGSLHQLQPNSSGEANAAFPRLLSQTGLFESVVDHRVAAGVIPYSINAEPWMDGASAQRYLAIPGMGRLGIYTENRPQVGNLRGHWTYPDGTVFLKTISLPTGDDRFRRLETQLLHYNTDHWRAYNYIWNEDQTDAALAEDVSSTTEIAVHDPSAPGGERRQTWHSASRTQCILCHTSRGGTIYGFHPAQLNREHDYGAVTADQLRTLRHIELFDEVQVSAYQHIVDPYDTEQELDQRARAYLHVNCAHCHRRGGGGTAHLELPYELPLERTHLLDARPTQGSFDVLGAKVLASGDPYRSILLYRMSKLGRGRMPYVGSSVMDRAGVQLIHDWISGLPAETSDGQPVREAQQQAIQRLLAQQVSPSAADADIRLLLSSTSGALMLAVNLVDRHHGDPLVQQVVAAVATHPQLQIRDLFEPHIPSEKRAKRLGGTVDPAEILALVGDVERGEQLFGSAAGVQCRNCHRIGDIGKSLGPDLDKPIRAPGKAQLLEAILSPSKDIDPAYVAQLVETADGRLFVGMVVSRTDEELVLKDAQNTEHRLPVASIQFQTPQQKSLMPELLTQDLTAQELADLLAFLAAKQPAASASD